MTYQYAPAANIANIMSTYFCASKLQDSSLFLLLPHLLPPYPKLNMHRMTQGTKGLFLFLLSCAPCPFMVYW